MAENISLLIGISTFVGGLVSLYGAAVKKQVASERDFKHLARNYDNLSGNIAALSDLIDNRLDQLCLTVMKVEARQDIILSQTRDVKKEK